MSLRLSVTERPATTSLSGGPLVLISRVELREIRMRLLHPFETSFGVTQDRRILLVKVSDGSLEGYGEVTAGEGPFYCHETVDTAWYILSDFICPRACRQRTSTNPKSSHQWLRAFVDTTWRKADWRQRSGTWKHIVRTSRFGSCSAARANKLSVAFRLASNRRSIVFSRSFKRK